MFFPCLPSVCVSQMHLYKVKDLGGYNASCPLVPQLTFNSTTTKRKPSGRYQVLLAEF